MDHVLQNLIDDPIRTAARANKIFLPMGRRTPPREAKKEIPPEMIKEAKEYRQRKADKQQAELLDYYATTTVPFDRIATHMRMEPKYVAQAMKARGRDK